MDIDKREAIFERMSGVLHDVEALEREIGELRLLANPEYATAQSLNIEGFDFRRELSLVLTKMDEARLWLQQAMGIVKVS